MRYTELVRLGQTILLIALIAYPVVAQEAPQAAPEGKDSDSFGWSDRIWLSGQANFIAQAKPNFHALYSGANSFQPNREGTLSRVLTLYSGFSLTQRTSILFNVEETGGKGLSQALGIAGYTNLDVVRNPTLGQSPYVARIMIHQVIPLGHTEEVSADRSFLSLQRHVPARRLELRFGKMSTADFFDVNAVGTDSHLQFQNWAVDNNGAFDYAADTRGYTYGFIAEYWDHDWTFRFGEMLMPTVANGINLDWSILRARGQNFELERRHTWLGDRHGVIRLLGFLNYANMGSYREAIHAYRSGEDDTPDVTLHRRQSRTKYGFGVNVEQELTPRVRAFGRFGWSDGRNESFAYTEIDQTILLGADLRGDGWHRPADRLGLAWVSNGISGDHREYLRLGGLGFLLGDGNLRYGRETILETYYRWNLGHGFSFSPGAQYVWNPGYNRDRGPAFVAAVRLHYEISTPWSR